MNCANPCMDWISGWSHKHTVSALGDFCWLVGGGGVGGLSNLWCFVGSSVECYCP